MENISGLMGQDTGRQEKQQDTERQKFEKPEQENTSRILDDRDKQKMPRPEEERMRTDGNKQDQQKYQQPEEERTIDDKPRHYNPDDDLGRDKNEIR